MLSSRGTDVQAAVVGRRLADAHRYLSKVVGFEPRVRVAALDAKDLSKVTSFPVFGFPHFVDDDIIVVGSQPSSSFRRKTLVAANLLAASIMIPILTRGLTTVVNRGARDR